MPSSDHLENRLRKELYRKISIVESSHARPSEGLIQERIRYYGNKCYEANQMIQQARYEYAALRSDKEHLFNRRGGAFHYLVKLRQLAASHRQQRKELVTFTELFVLSHEWYEILVTADEVEELSRLEFLSKLGEEEYVEPTEPGDRNYPEPVKTHRSYYQKDVTTMIRHQLIKFDALLEEEQEACEFAEAETRRNTTLEDEALRQMRESFDDLQDEIRRQKEDNTEWIETVRDSYYSFMEQNKRNVENSKAMAAELKRVEANQREIITQMTRYMNECQHLAAKIEENLMESRSREEEKQMEHDCTSPGCSRTGYKRKHYGVHIPTADKEKYETILKQSLQELQEIDDFLSYNVIKERRYGDRVMKETEEGMACVYCKTKGRHYSDACPEVRLVSKRLEILNSEKRCKECLGYHYRKECTKKLPCFYCKAGKYQDDFDHHCSVCRKPEEVENKLKRRGEMQII
ncbi:hypothetical protein V3C99_005343, partial [Haemonchus contortus]